ncbi:MAG: hypothetical protein ABR589_03585 [Chthoniobacterales bacterium]
MNAPHWSESARAWMQRVEWILAAVLILLILILHLANMRHAGGLWRDETAAVNLALLPGFSDVWANLEHESFPLLFTMLLRGWSALGFAANDVGLRTFGLIVGLVLLAALWWSGRRLSTSPPLLALVLFGLSPIAIRWGDSLRAYGLGVLFLILVLGTVWQVVRAPSRRNVTLAIFAGVLAVQSLYPAAFVLAAICLAGAALPLRRGDAKHALLLVGIGIPAALSLLPYLGVVGRANQWNVVTQVPIDLTRIGLVLHRALSAPTPVMFWFWTGLLAAAVIGSVLSLARWKRAIPRDNEEREIAWFLLSVIITTTAAYYLFLKIAKFPTETWYYLPWMAVVALATDALIARLVRIDALRATRLVFVIIAAGLCIPGAWKGVHTRMTNLDLVAERLNRIARSHDLVLVHPWFCVVSLKRYYTGPAEVATLPPLGDFRLQRLDLLKEQMQREDPLRPLLEKTQTTLRNGHTVWLVGYFLFSNPPQPAPRLPRAGEGPQGWRSEPYMIGYGMEMAYFLQTHARASSPVQVTTDAPVNPFENLPVRAISGWRPPRVGGFP